MDGMRASALGAAEVFQRLRGTINVGAVHAGARKPFRFFLCGDPALMSELRGLLLDGHGLGEAGGSGRTFDWSQMPRDLTQPLILAGGLTTGNVARAIRIAKPWAVDVASGIEISPGIKDAVKMAALIDAVRSVAMPA